MLHPWNGSSLTYITESEAVQKEEPFFLKCLIAQCPSQKAVASRCLRNLGVLVIF